MEPHPINAHFMHAGAPPPMPFAYPFAFDANVAPSFNPYDPHSVAQNPHQFNEFFNGLVSIDDITEGDRNTPPSSNESDDALERSVHHAPADPTHHHEAPPLAMRAPMGYPVASPYQRPAASPYQRPAASPYQWPVDPRVWHAMHVAYQQRFMPQYPPYPPLQHMHMGGYGEPLMSTFGHFANDYVAPAPPPVVNMKNALRRKTRAAPKTRPPPAASAPISPTTASASTLTPGPPSSPSAPRSSLSTMSASSCGSASSGASVKGARRSSTDAVRTSAAACDICGKQVRHRRNLYRHKRAAHNIFSMKWYTPRSAAKTPPAEDTAETPSVEMEEPTTSEISEPSATSKIGKKSRAPKGISKKKATTPDMISNEQLMSTYKRLSDDYHRQEQQAMATAVPLPSSTYPMPPSSSTYPMPPMMHAPAVPSSGMPFYDVITSMQSSDIDINNW